MSSNPKTKFTDPALSERVVSQHIRWVLDAHYPNTLIPGYGDFAEAIVGAIEAFAATRGIQLWPKDAILAANERTDAS